jgi:hypothetical protein
MWKNMVEMEQATDDNIIWRMCFACWITKATNTQSEYEIVIDFPIQQRLREPVSILGFTYMPVLLHPRRAVFTGR